ncbi:unnamed protein product [Linum tenue]|uniref:Uncharacterized protein n=1 Tax=Linum tenue TaxID=586396 RepID=A0AAV0P1R7_9ROSI|nr:unnamed protein product [Linum tenue]
MKSKAGQNRNVFVRIITCPFRVLGRARDLYVRSLTECATGASHNPSRRRVPYHPSQYSSLPRSLSAASSISNNDGEDLRELMRAASVRVYGHKNEAEMYVEQLRQLRQQETAGPGKVLPKSVSVGMGFMGRIDEDKACEEFEEGAAAADGSTGGRKSDVSKKAEKYPRSKSYAPASKRLAVF